MMMMMTMLLVPCLCCEKPCHLADCRNSTDALPCTQTTEPSAPQPTSSSSSSRTIREQELQVVQLTAIMVATTIHNLFPTTHTHTHPNKNRQCLTVWLPPPPPGLTTAAQCSATAWLPLLSTISFTASTQACQPCSQAAQQRSGQDSVNHSHAHLLLDGVSVHTTDAQACQPCITAAPQQARQCEAYT
jgi:hypothetical protein